MHIWKQKKEGLPKLLLTHYVSAWAVLKGQLPQRGAHKPTTLRAKGKNAGSFPVTGMGLMTDNTSYRPASVVIPLKGMTRK